MRCSLSTKVFLILLISCTYGCLLSGCSTSSGKQFAGFDSQSWKQDKGGCTGKRKALSESFERIRPDLKGLSQAEVLQLLGRPDFQQLYKRNQKFYIYFLESGIQCGGNLEQSRARTVIFRFNAIELLTEVYYHTGKPE